MSLEMDDDANLTQKSEDPLSIIFKYRLSKGERKYMSELSFMQEQKVESISVKKSVHNRHGECFLKVLNLKAVIRSLWKERREDQVQRKDVCQIFFGRELYQRSIGSTVWKACLTIEPQSNLGKADPGLNFKISFEQ